MTAGLPAIGLSGLFVLLTALAMPLAYVLRRGRSVRPWLSVLMLAVASILVAGLVWAGVRALAFGATPSWPAVVLPAGVSVLVLALVVGIPELLLKVVGQRRTPLPPPVVATPRSLEPQGVVSTGPRNALLSQ